MTALAPAARDRLVKSLALLSSPVDGEKLAAAEAACRIIAAAGLTWAELLETVAIRPEPFAPPWSTWHDTCGELAKHPGNLSPWERRFVSDLPNFPSISAKQQRVLDEISARVLGRSQ